MALHDDITSDADLASIVDVKVDFIQQWRTGVCTPANSHHSTSCPSQGAETESCDCLAGFAIVCAKEHDPQWWEFTACMFDHNGGPQATYNGLESDSTFESTTQSCADLQLSSYGFDDLKTCYTGDEGNQLAKASAARTSTYGASLPVWILVNGKLVASKNPREAMSTWTARVKTAICSAYQGNAPSSCASLV